MERTQSRTETPELVPIGEIVKSLPSRVAGKRLHRSTVFGWIRSGRLAARKIAGAWYITREQFQELMEGEGPKRIPKGRKIDTTPRCQSASHKRAVEELKKRGAM